MVYVRAVITKGNRSAYDRQIGILTVVGGVRYDKYTGRGNIVNTVNKEVLASSMKGTSKTLLQISGQPDYMPPNQQI